jgi:hypothetical protein
MVHFTCDLCGKDLPATGEPRFVVKVETYAGIDPTEITEEDLDEDHMEAIADLLQRDPHHRHEDPDGSSHHAFRYDLCPECHRRFLKDPLNREVLRTLDFSKN